jgi:hypothetical protein
MLMVLITDRIVDLAVVVVVLLRLDRVMWISGVCALILVSLVI